MSTSRPAWMDKLNAGAGIGGSLGTGIAGLINKNRMNPAQHAGKQLENMPPFLMMLMSKYGNRGDQAAGPLMDQYMKLTNDPSSVLSSIGKNYKESPGYQFSKDQALTAAGNAAAAGGFTGSPAHQQSAMDAASGLASRDYENYLGHALGLYGGGLSGLEGFNKQGYDATSDFAKMMQDYFGSKAGIDFESAAEGNKDTSNILNQLFGAGGSLLSLLPHLFGG